MRTKLGQSALAAALVAVALVVGPVANAANGGKSDSAPGSASQNNGNSKGDTSVLTTPGDKVTGKPVEAPKPIDVGKPLEVGKPADTGKDFVNVKNDATGKPLAVEGKASFGNVEKLTAAEKKAAAAAKAQAKIDNGNKVNYIVRFNESAVVGNEVSALKASKIAVGRTFAHVFKGLVAKMTVKQAAALAKRSTVAAVEADATAEIQASETSATWGIDRIDQTALPLSTTYDYANTGAGVTAYVIDTGIYAANADFGGRVAAGYTAVLDGNGTVDCNGHGTHVAGTIGSTTFGVAKSVKLIPVRVLDCAGSGSYSNVVAGLDWVAQNYVAGTPAVANLSLGGPISSTLDTAINNLINRGVTVVVAAGNSAADACGASPARVPNAITVAASDRYDQFASFSNYLVPLFGVMLGALFLGEQIQSTTGVALALILGSVALNQWAQQRRQQREAALCQAS